MNRVFLTLILTAFIAMTDFAGSAAQTSANGPIVTNTAIIKTSMGDIEVELYGKDAPKTVANFVGLANKNFYDGILFHRVVPGFVIQAGDPKTKDSSLKAEWGTGGESIYGAKFEDELNANAPSFQRGYVEGTLAMANSGANTNSSQFFIMLSNSQLPKLYNIFGKVTKGLDIVHAIENTALVNGSVPKVPVVIKGVETTEIKAKAVEKN